MAYTIKTVRGKLLANWVRDTRRELHEEIAVSYDEERWLKIGLAKHVTKNTIKINVVKVKLVQVVPE